MIVPSSGARRRISIGDCTPSTLSLSVSPLVVIAVVTRPLALVYTHIHENTTNPRTEDPRTEAPPTSLSLYLPLFVSLSLSLSNSVRRHRRRS